MKNVFRKYGVIILLLFSVSCIKAQSVQIVSKLVINEEVVGDQAVYTISEKRLNGSFQIYDTDDSYTITVFRNGMKHGVEEAYNPKEVLLYKGYYSDGLKDGNWTYYQYRSVTHIENYKKGKADGTWIYYDTRSDKSIKKEDVYIDNLLTEQREYYLNGVLGSIAYYKDGLRSGVWKTFYQDSKLNNSTTYTLNRKNGLYESYYDNGQLHQKGNYKDGYYTGDWASCYKDGTVSVKFTVKEDGENREYTFETYHPNGKLKRKGISLDGYLSYFHNTLYDYYDNGQLESEVNYLRGSRDGVSKLFYKDGKLKETGTYKKGLRSGEFKAYYENGKPKSVIVYGDTERKINEDRYLMNGLYKTFYQDGTLEEEGNYINEVKDGVWKSFKENGQPYFIEIYEMGTLVKNVDKSEFDKYLK